VILRLGALFVFHVDVFDGLDFHFGGAVAAPLN
jgi:hypothetical protein